MSRLSDEGSESMQAIKQRKVWDAIVIGSGMTGGWAAKELSEAGLEVLVLEAGRQIEPEDYEDHTPPWELEYRGLEDHRKATREQPIQTLCYACDEWGSKFFVNDHDEPYSVAPESQGFRYIRGRHVGGRSIMWGRQSYRWSDLDFEANARDGFGVDWPIRYADLAPAYDRVERFAGISGQREGNAQLPDGQFLPAMPLNCMEERSRERLMKAFGGSHLLTPARVAVLTERHNGRSACHYCGPCRRGCRTRSYFSSINATLPAAAATGRMTLRPHSVVAELIYDQERDRVRGVRVIDGQTKADMEFDGRIVFLCASAIESARLLLNSKSPRFSDGLANSSDQVGRNLMDHTFQVGASGRLDGLEDKYVRGRRPGGAYVPRFVNVDQNSKRDFLRGYGFQVGASRSSRWRSGVGTPDFGADWKSGLRGLTQWRMNFTGFGECLPNPDNRVTIDSKLVDKWGIPAPRFNVSFGENERAIREDIKKTAVEMLEAVGAHHITTYDRDPPPGFAIHEMGTARMGRDPKTSVLNQWCQSWDVPNLFISDGAAMASSACQNPSLTYMALTVRASGHAVAELKRGAI